MVLHFTVAAAPLPSPPASPHTHRSLLPCRPSLSRVWAVGSEAAIRTGGKLRMEGRKYVVQDGDIIFFKFNVSSGGKKK
jgi:hypothetical protein